MEDSWKPGIVIAAGSFMIYIYFKYKSIKNKLEEIHEEADRQRNVLNDVLNFRASGLDDCEKHIYQKRMCYKCDCPYRKLRYIVDTLGSSRKSLDVCIHLLTSVEIANCLIESHNSGVRVRVLCDHEMSTNKGSQIRSLCEAGIPVRVPLLNYHMHSKMAVIDNNKLMTGSVNWTVQGMYGNWDNLLVTGHKELVQNAISCFDKMWNNTYTSNITK